MSIHIVWHIKGDVVYGHSQLGLPPFDPSEPGETTPEEEAAGVVHRHIHFTAEDAWTFSTCLDCGLPLPLHPDERRKRSRRRYCREARRASVGLS